MSDITPTAKDLARDLLADLKICNESTPGPWTWGDEDQAFGFEGEKLWRYFIARADDLHPVICMTPVSSGVGGGNQCDDVEFIAVARTALPAAIRRAIAAEAEVARLRAELAALKEQQA